MGLGVAGGGKTGASARVHSRARPKERRERMARMIDENRILRVKLDI